MTDNTPDHVARWLRATLEIRPHGHLDRPILERLAGDDRISSLWDKNEAGGLPWQSQVKLIACAFHFAQRAMLDALQKPAGCRGEVATAQTALSAAARMLIKAIEDAPDEAARLWAGLPVGYIPEAIDYSQESVDSAPIRELVIRLNSLAGRAEAEADAIRNALADLPPPSKQGRGDPAQLAYRKAFDAALTEDVPQLSQTKRNRIIALLTSVIFDRDVDADTISRTRQRQQRKSPTNPS
jgi:hypothetical protein